ncbi:MAG: NAD-dependent epimerase/dehydratase family protein [Bacteroidia bacterium]|nr:NAD-dependent epimerase/dehydratase family protein [Bacteroidia bacterium]
MKTLITGGAGFIGSHLAAYLHARGDEIVVLDNLSTGRRENIAALEGNPRFRFVLGNVTDKATVEALAAECDHIYHLAAPVGVKRIMERPVLTILDNIRGADVVTEAAHKYGAKLLVASTSEVYGRSLDLLDPSGKRKLCEDDYRIEGSTQNHRWAYANTKALDEFLALAYHKEYGLATVVVRFFNTVGPGQLSDYGMVIPNFVRRALRNRPPEIYGTGEQKRSFLHVNDAVRAVVALMEEPKAVGEVFNLGNPEEITINELARKIIAAVGSDVAPIYKDYLSAYGKGFEDMNRRTADISKIQKIIGFEITYSIDQIIADVVEYERGRMYAGV